jgi:hypothetical protein
MTRGLELNAVALPIALTKGSWVLVGFMVIMFFGVVYGYYTVKGSGISETPYGKIHGGAPGAIGKSSASGKDERVTERDWSRGTK